MGFARARREIVTFPHGATDKSFLLLFSKKKRLLASDPAFNKFRNKSQKEPLPSP